jgi:hypothetical protein
MKRSSYLQLLEFLDFTIPELSFVPFVAPLFVRFVVK